MIVAFWLVSTGWLAYREWWPWLRTDTSPPFTVELADEAAPQYAQWSIWRGDRKIGAASTTMSCRKDDTFELQSTIDHLEWLEAGAVKIIVPRLSTVQKVTRDGQLLSINSNLRLTVNAPGKDLEMQAGLEGMVKNGKLSARVWLESNPTGRMEQQLDLLPLESGSVINPLQPVAKLAVHPGQRWKITSVDPLEQAVGAALKQTPFAKLVDAAPKVVLAEVLSEPQELMHQGIAIRCYLVEYRSKDFDGRTWVRVSDSKVLRQEVNGNGEKLTLLRED
jgi:hypothetical protein